jgi:hypothetical protein
MLTMLTMIVACTSAHAQKGDSAYYLAVSKGQVVTLDQMNAFHESDNIISTTVNASTPNEKTVIFYNQTPADYAVYTFYILRDNYVIKSRCIRVYYPKTAKK